MPKLVAIVLLGFLLGHAAKAAEPQTDQKRIAEPGARDAPTGDSLQRPPWAGFFTIRSNGPIDRKRFPYIKGFADRVQWRQVEPQPGVYDWAKMDASIHDAAEGGYYYYFVLWTGPHSPEWIYRHGVPRVKTTGRAGGTREEYPYYLDPNYVRFFHRFIGELADHLASLPEAERKAIAFIQPAFGSTGDRQLYKGKPKEHKYDISPQQYLEFCSGATTRFYEAFDKPELKHIRFLFNVADARDPASEATTKKEFDGEQLYANWLRRSYPIELRKQQFTIAVGYQVNGEITQDTELRPTFFGLNGKAPEFVRGEFSKFAEGGIFQENPVWNYYWTAISTVDRGLDLWEVDYATVKTGNYDDGFEFSSRYSYYKQPQTSPCAFIALRDVLDSADTVRFPEAMYGPATQNNAGRVRKIEAEFRKYGAKVGDLEAATLLNGSKYLLEAKAINDVGFGLIARNFSRFITQIDANETSVGLWRVGPADQPFGRYARAFENSSGRNRMYFDVDDRFLSANTDDTVTLKVIYLDQGSGKFSVRYDATSDPDKTAATIAKANSGRWLNKSILIADGEFTNKGPRNSDFSLVGEDVEDHVFHMIEIAK